ncbi:hypothetical protein K458DRAFT_428011 [Lentithecium fluviatile CBS 122367]|uniref:Arrestin-like N-terminal domain-containing protein n=1 Tax=Lentithecium fluviatile CBS 122367 TaxID=1168545 RepID=A0A6G1JD15_9PLEO|nr:hypothetical protein K458DRAFT_428011 [Lentithecium fluviatile CBS 122367]
MAIPLKDQKLLSTFPRPPPGSPSPANLPLPSPRPSDFGFIPVGLSRDDDADSLYDDPPVDAGTTAASAPILPALPSTHNEELQLVLDSPSRTFSPLDTITGYVLGWDPTTQIHIILEGRAKTYLREAKIHYKDRAPLLYESVHLKPTASNVIPRFSITVPERTVGGLERLNEFAPKDTVYGPYWASVWPALEPYENGADHPLPPSMTASVRNLNASGWGRVSYKLIAVRSEVDNTTGKLTPNASCQVPVRITTRRLPSTKVQDLMGDAHIVASDLSIQTAQLSKDRRLSIREQLRDAFNLSAPTFYFKASTTTAKLSTPGADLKVSISIAILPPPPGQLYNFPVPNIAIARLHFRLRSYTGLRVLRLPPDEQKPPKSYTFKEYELETRQSPSGAAFTPKNGGFNGQSCVSTIALPGAILPSFKTYNLWRSYRLECEVTFSIAGKEVSVKSRSDLNIVARPAGSAEATGGLQQELDAEDDAASLQIAQAIVQTGLRLGSAIRV